MKLRHLLKGTKQKGAESGFEPRKADFPLHGIRQKQRVSEPSFSYHTHVLERELSDKDNLGTACGQWAL